MLTFGASVFSSKKEMILMTSMVLASSPSFSKEIMLPLVEKGHWQVVSTWSWLLFRSLLSDDQNWDK
jgi:hypothetical protein